MGLCLWPLLSHVWSLSCVFVSLFDHCGLMFDLCQVFAVCFEVTLYDWLDAKIQLLSNKLCLSWLDAKIQLLSNKLCLSLLLNFWRRKSLLQACSFFILLKLVLWAPEFTKSLKSPVNSPCPVQFCSLLSLSYDPPPPPPPIPPPPCIFVTIVLVW